MRPLHRRRSVAVVATCLLIVGPGSAALFAGGTGTWNQVLYRMTLGAAPLTGAAGVEARAVGFPTASTDRLPAPAELALFDAPEPIERLLGRMWDESPMFRRQCTRLSQASVQVRVSLDLRGDQLSAAATTEVERRGILTAHVHLRPVDSNHVRHLAHEIEHLLEQLDGVDLRAAVAGGVRGVRPAHTSEAFETDRAIAVGRRVALEVQRRGR
jgi:hypothetical protein